ncbi:hypothetical protein SteCoe_23571 [Stentor coeruleus]|uniref:Uncharacterized protein n=1 Tax=Stentor coeruleus TaxID=5963 RepID=A0A1R2BJL6_9CILI|nr:hypothetical protein SteCoe_23571 [Stentor coeruleus]
MDFSSSGSNWRFARIACRRSIKNPYCYNSNTAQTKKISEVKEILKKYLTPHESKDRSQDIGRSLESVKKAKSQKKQKLSPNRYDDDNVKDKPILFDAMKIHCRSPVLRIRKSKSKGITVKNDVSMKVQKLALTKSSGSRKRFRHRDSIRLENSSYSSYSDIFKVLVGKIPLK